MSLSDYIKYQRAVKGGLTPWEIAEGSGVSSRDVHLLEVKHRRMGEDDTMLQKLADYFAVPLSELTQRREAYRKRLISFLDEYILDDRSIALKLENGEEVGGIPAWYSREAIALRPEGSTSDDTDLCIVQRAWISDWKLSDASNWEISSQSA
ncbi:MAG: hypothetical protein ABIQ44_11610 [Chloroflexia bacterium]